ncbi:MAG: VWA domain-containing protein [Desulfobacteraceae bacterium]|nr:VWA domain-containing protein [Desulfobacteraceae bacterium]
MKFLHPDMLYFLWAVVFIFSIMVYGIRKRKKVLFQFASSRILSVLIPGYSRNRPWVKAVLLSFAFGFAVMALSGPLMGYRWEKTTTRGVDIMIALDCSRSMLAQDIKPNRLERAKREIIDLLRMIKGDRAGLVAFSGTAILQCPLTLDHQAFNIFLRVLGPDYLPVGGTRLDTAINTCLEAFEENVDTQKAIILITDGENTAGDVEKTVNKLSEQGIKLFCIGVGNPSGAPIPDKEGGFKKDKQGNIILSKVDESGLERLSALTSGRYVRSVAGDMDLDLIYTNEIKGTMEQKTLESGRRKVWENRYQWFLLPCVILLLLELLIPALKKPSILPIIFLAILLPLVFQPKEASANATSHVKEGVSAFEENRFEDAKKHFIDAQLEKPEDEQIYFNIGTAAYKNGEFDLAETNFLKAAQSHDIVLRHKAMYNLANTRFRLGKLDDAIKEYEKIVEQYPQDKEAKENLEFVKQKKKEQKQQSDKDSKDKKDSDSQDQKQCQDQNKNQDQKEQGQQDQKNKSNGENEQKDSQSKPAQSSEKEKKGDSSSKPQPGENQDQKEQPKQDQSDQASMADAKDARPSDGQKDKQNMLNRLEDMPGMGLMPKKGNIHIEKDW